MASDRFWRMLGFFFVAQLFFSPNSEKLGGGGANVVQEKKGRKEERKTATERILSVAVAGVGVERSRWRLQDQQGGAHCSQSRTRKHYELQGTRGAW